MDIVEEEYLATTKREAKELAKEEAQAGTLEQEIKGIRGSTEVNEPLEHKQRLIIQLLGSQSIERSSMFDSLIIREIRDLRRRILIEELSSKAY